MTSTEKTIGTNRLIDGDKINNLPADTNAELANKVDKEVGKGLSTNDYTTAEKNKLAGIEAGAQVNTIDSVVGGTDISIDLSDPLNPVINYIGTGGGGQILFDAIVANSGGDYTTIGAAVTAGKKTIFVKKGTYVETDSITLTNNYIIVGTGYNETIVQFPIGKDGFKLYGNNSILSGLYIDTYTNSGEAPVVIGDGQITGSPDTTKGNNNIIKNCYIRGRDVYGKFSLYVAGASYPTGGAVFYFDCEDLQTGNTIQDCIIEGHQAGDVAVLGLQKNGKFINNKVIGGRIADYMNRDCIIEGNIIEDSDGDGIFIAGPNIGGSTSNNVIVNAVTAGIKTQNQLENPVTYPDYYIQKNIKNNSVYKSGDIAFSIQNCINSNIDILSDTAGNHGLYIQDSKQNNFGMVSIKNPNENSNARGSGVYMVSNVINNNFENIEIDDNRTVQKMHSGFANREDTTCIGNSINNLTIKGKNNERTIWLQSNNWKINNIYAEGGKYAGLRLDGASYCIIDNIHLKNNTEDANNAYGELWLQNGASNNMISKILTESTNSNKANSGILIDSGCNNNKIGENINIGAVTASITDNGTGNLKPFITKHITTSTTAVAYTTYICDATSGNIAITLPNVTSGDTSEYRIILAKDTNKVTITTIGGTQLIGEKTIQTIQTINGQLYLKGNGVDGYNIITDTRQYFRLIELTGAGSTDLSSSGYESGSVYHCEPGTGNTRTITIPDSSIDCIGNYAYFLLSSAGTVIIQTISGELINGLPQITLSLPQDCVCLVCMGDHYDFLTDSRPKVQNTSLSLFSLTEDSTILDPDAGFTYYRQTCTTQDDSRYNKVTSTAVNSPTITGSNIYGGGVITDQGVPSGIIPAGPIITYATVRKLSGVGNFNFYIAFYKYIGGVETLIATSGVSQTISSGTFADYFVTAVLPQTDFGTTGRLIRKIFLNKVGLGTNPVAQYYVEGPNPSYSVITVSAGNISHNILAGIQLADTGVTYGHITDQAQSIYGVKTFNNELGLKQIATPSNPASGYNKLYFKSDDKLYKLTSGGVESEVGTGGSFSWGSSASGATGTGLTLTKQSGATDNMLLQTDYDGNPTLRFYQNFIGSTNTFASLDFYRKLNDSNNRNMCSLIPYSDSFTSTTDYSGGFRIEIYKDGTNTGNFGYNSSGNFILGGYTQTLTGSGTNGIFMNSGTAATISNATQGFLYNNSGTLTWINSGADNQLDLSIPNSASSIKGWTVTVGNTQTNAQIGGQIDLGTASVASKGMLIKAYGASTTQTGLEIDLSTTGTGSHLRLLKGTAAIAPVTEGDLVYNGTNLYFKPAGTAVDLLAGGGLTWGSSISGTTTGGLNLTLNANSDASAIAQNITINNTQANAVTGLNVAMGTADKRLKGISINSSTYTAVGAGLMVDSSASAVQAVANIPYGILVGDNKNTNSANPYTGIFVTNKANASSGYNTGIAIISAFATASLSTTTPSSGVGMGIYQSGAGGTALAISGGTSVNTATNGLFNITIGNTQSGASILQKLEFGSSTSVQHIGVYASNTGETNCKNIGFKFGTTYSLTQASNQQVGFYKHTSANISIGFLNVAGSNVDVSGQTNIGFMSYGDYSQGSENDTNHWHNYIAPISTTTNVPQGMMINFSSRTSGTAGRLLALYTGVPGDTAITVKTTNSMTAPTNGLVYYNLTNTQSNAITMQKIDTGTSSVGHTGYLAQVYNASTSASAFSAQLSTTGTGIGYKANSSALSGAGVLMNLNHTASGTLTANTTDQTTIQSSRTYTLTSGSVTDNYNVSYLKRTSITTGAGGTLLSQGSVLKLENVATQTAGTLTDTVNVLKIIQDADSTGYPISITQNAVVSTNYRKLITETATGITIWMGNGTTANGTLSGTAGDILINGGSNKPEYCTGTTNRTALV